jgi:glycosyltransferase involved in cell wall biosynthesis
VPRVSVIIPVYNDERFLPESIRSVLGQTFRDIELVLIDDGLTDQSWKIVEGAALVFMLPGGIESVHAQQASPSAQNRSLSIRAVRPQTRSSPHSKIFYWIRWKMPFEMNHRTPPR